MAVSPPKPYSHTNKRQMYDSQSICLFSNVYHSALVWLTSLKLSYIANEADALSRSVFLKPFGNEIHFMQIGDCCIL